MLKSSAAARFGSVSDQEPHEGRTWGRLTEDPIVRFSIGFVAPAGSGLESAAVEHRDVVAAVTDEPTFLRGACRLRDANAADAKHQGQELLRDMEAVGVRAKPTRVTSTNSAYGK